jgi:ADP-heptose:LPS heptosyltransferase
MKETSSSTAGETRHLNMDRTRVLILRPDNIGDVLLFTGALRHIRNLYPEAHITLAVQAHIVNLVELCPHIDACVPVDELTWRGKVEHKGFTVKPEMERAITIANKLWNFFYRPFDIVIYPVKSPQVPHLRIIDCLNGGKTFGMTGCNLNAPGKGYPETLKPSSLLKKQLDVSTSDPWVHELLITLDFLVFMGCEAISLDDIRPEFWLDDSEKNHLHGLQRNGRNVIGLFPGASHREKRWESHNYGELAKRLGQQQIYVIFGSSEDRELAKQAALFIKANCENAEILDFTGQSTLRTLVKTIMSCDLLISMDTSGLHMAVAAGVPAIGIVGGGHFGRFVPWGDPAKHIFLTNKTGCFHCNWQCIHDEAECITGVSPQEVAMAASKLLNYEWQQS